MTWDYLLAPAAAWLMAGTLKFLINSLRAHRWAFDQIGYGGLPSNHSAIVSATLTLIALKEGIQHPAFGSALTLAVIVIMDAHSLRRQIGAQAAVINQLTRLHAEYTAPPLRERVGHSRTEILAGISSGIVTALVLYYGSWAA